MDDKTHQALEQLREQLAELRNSRTDMDQVSKRLDDLRAWALGILGSAGTLVAVLAIVFTWNVNAEKVGLRNFEDRMEQRMFGLSADPPKLELLTADGRPLKNSVVEATIRFDGNGDPELEVHYIGRNNGGSATGPIYLKLYTDQNLELDFSSTDEPDYAYEEHFSPDLITPSALPVGVSTSWVSTVPLPKTPGQSIGRVRALFKAFYGRREITRVEFNMEIRFE